MMPEDYSTKQNSTLRSVRAAAWIWAVWAVLMLVVQVIRLWWGYDMVTIPDGVIYLPTDYISLELGPTLTCILYAVLAYGLARRRAWGVAWAQAVAWVLLVAGVFGGALSVLSGYLPYFGGLLFAAIYLPLHVILPGAIITLLHGLRPQEIAPAPGPWEIRIASAPLLLRIVACYVIFAPAYHLTTAIDMLAPALLALAALALGIWTAARLLQRCPRAVWSAAAVIALCVASLSQQRAPADVYSFTLGAALHIESVAFTPAEGVSEADLQGSFSLLPHFSRLYYAPNEFGPFLFDNQVLLWLILCASVLWRLRRDLRQPAEEVPVEALG